MIIKSTFPFNTKRFPFFYGWVIVFAGTIGVVFSIPGQTMGISAFTDHLIEALQISRDSLALAYLLGTVFSSFFLTLAGKLWDLHGARIVVSAAALSLAFFLLMGSFSDQISASLSQHTGLSYSGVAFTLITIVFFGVRFSGQGVLTLVSRNVIMKWFDRNRGLANGIGSAFIAFLFSISPLFLVFLIKKHSWQGAWQIIAALLVGFVVFALTLFRDNPEDCGTIPDGKKVPLKQKKASGFENREQYTLSQAFKTWALWVYSLAIAFYSFYNTGFTFHIESIFANNGYDGDYGFQILPYIAYISITLSIIGNIVSDYIRLQYLLFMMVFGALCSAVGLAILNSNLGLIMLIVGNGVMGGMFVVLIAVSWPRFFGRKNLGTISGFSGSVLQFSSAIGPYLFSKSLSITGDYDMAAYLSIAYILLLIPFAFKAKNPQINYTMS